MPPRSLLRGFIALWLLTGVALIAGSVATVRVAIGSNDHANPHVALLAGVEAIAALLFVIPQSMRLGAAGLLATIAIAFVVHAALGQFRADLLVYGAAVTFVAIHGSLTRAQWRTALTVS
jgi:hypothetical protein